MTLEHMKNVSLRTMEERVRNGSITPEEFDEYVYLWRNSAFRYSDLYSQYETPDRKEKQ
jgi:hypothetical protein